MSDLPPAVRELLQRAAGRSGRVLVLTGAGVSAESGIPTFRGRDGFWRAGSRNFMPEELATAAAFDQVPDILWGWYLWRRSICRGAAPNAGHVALARLEQALGDRFLLVTQNVDGLHLRAGNSPARTWQIHGNIGFMRCTRGCSRALHRLPAELDGREWPKETPAGSRELALLVCPACGAPARPHVLWFDESYNEELYHWDSAQTAARDAALLIVAGTSGATNLPMLMAEIAFRRRVPMLVVNADPNPFAQLALANDGVFLQGASGELLPPVAERIAVGFGSAPGQRERRS